MGACLARGWAHRMWTHRSPAYYPLPNRKVVSDRNCKAAATMSREQQRGNHTGTGKGDTDTARRPQFTAITVWRCSQWHMALTSLASSASTCDLGPLQTDYHWTPACIPTMRQHRLGVITYQPWPCHPASAYHDLAPHNVRPTGYPVTLTVCFFVPSIFYTTEAQPPEPQV